MSRHGTAWQLRRMVCGRYTLLVWPGVRQPRVGPAAPHGKGRADALPGAYIRAYISRDAALFVASSRQQACAKKHTHMRAGHSYQRQCRLRTAAMALARRMALAWAIWQMYEGQGARGLRVQVRAATWRALTDPAHRRAAREEAFRDASTHAHGDGATFAPGCRPAYTPRWHLLGAICQSTGRLQL